MFSLLALFASSTITSSAADDFNNVRRQYEIFPYPDIGAVPADINDVAFVKKEAPRFLMANHFLFNGAWFKNVGTSTARPLKVLIAGGGTGRDTLLMAKEMEDSGIIGLITHVDLSQASIDVAREWVNSAGLQKHVYFQRNSIENFTAQHEIDGLPLFDFIWCSGVLHHLEDPLAGLNGLRRIMAPDGGMFVMVYGLHGRAGVYDMQAALRYALPSNELLSDRERVGELKDLLFGDAADKSRNKSHGISGLADTNTFALNQELANQLTSGDSALFDTVLHSQDVAYSVVDFYKYVNSAGLRVRALIPEASYEPQYTVFQTPKARQSYMARRIQNRTRLEQFHFSELMTSRPTYHSAFISHAEDWAASQMSYGVSGPQQVCEDKSWMHTKIPVLVQMENLQFPKQFIPNLQRMAVYRQTADINLDLSRSQGRAMARIPLPGLAFAFLEASLHGRRTGSKIISDVHATAMLWAKQLNSSMEPLTYQEVEDQFCDWVHKMEASVNVLWIHI